MKSHQLMLCFSLSLSIAACNKETNTSLQVSQSLSVNKVAVNQNSTNDLSPIHIIPSLFVKEITHPYFPLVPGTVFKYRNTILENKQVTTEHITVTVTNDVKRILGVACTVVHDQVITNSHISEDTYDWYAQDKLGDVWYFGENTKAYYDGQVDSSGSFEAGVDGALPGIIMWANPAAHIGQTYNQEFYKGEAEDKAMVTDTHRTITTIYGTFNDCLETKEFTPLEPGVIEYKYYAPGIGQILTVMKKGGKEREDLISISHS